MNAIAGRIGPGPDPNSTAVEKMIDGMRHRGKGEPIFAEGELGALAGCGPGALRAARQGGPIVVFDGYLINRRDAASSLGLLVDAPPTEIIDTGYARWGRDLVFRLSGGFAFALYDQQDRRLLLARDPIGVKPLYYAQIDEQILFGSEPKAIFSDHRFERRLSLAHLDILLQPRLAGAHETPLIGMSQVKPGHVVEFHAGVLREFCYWALESRPHEECYDSTVVRVRELLGNSVAGAVDGAEHCAAMLSGGLDSTTVTALAAVPKIDSYCVRFKGDAEEFSPSDMRPDIDAPFAAKAAELLGTTHHEVLLSTADLLRTIPATRRVRDLPGWGQFDASMHSLFGEMVKSAAPRALSGEAADELFGGYGFFFSEEVQTACTFPWLGAGTRLADYLDPDAAALIPPQHGDAGRYRSLLETMPRLTGESPVDVRIRELFYLCMQGTLTVVVERKDRMSAAWGLDLRLPFTDHQLIDYVWNIPWAFKSRSGVKGLLKDAVRDVVPRSTLERPKSAYPHLQSKLYHDALIKEINEIASGPHEGVRHFFAPHNLRALIASLVAAVGQDGFPGGSDPRYMLVHIAELHRWMLHHKIQI